MPRLPDYGSVLSAAFLPTARQLDLLGDMEGNAVADGSPNATEGESLELPGLANNSTSDGCAAGGIAHPMNLVPLLLMARQRLVVDLMRGIAVIAVHGAGRDLAIGWSPSVLARAILEAGRDIVWLCEPDIGAPERARRVVWDTAKGVRDRARTIPAARTAGVEPVIETDEVMDMAEAYGVEAQARPHGEYGVDLPHVAGTSPPKLMEASVDLMPTDDGTHAGPIFYNLMSDVAHASTSGVLGRSQVSLTDNNIGVRTSRNHELAHAVPVYWAVINPAARMAEYLGWDATQLHVTWNKGADRLTEAQDNYGLRTDYSGRLTR